MSDQFQEESRPLGRIDFINKTCHRVVPRCLGTTLQDDGTLLLKIGLLERKDSLRLPKDKRAGGETIPSPIHLSDDDRQRPIGRIDVADATSKEDLCIRFAGDELVDGERHITLELLYRKDLLKAANAEDIESPPKPPEPEPPRVA